MTGRMTWATMMADETSTKSSVVAALLVWLMGFRRDVSREKFTWTEEACSWKSRSAFEAFGRLVTSHMSKVEKGEPGGS